LIGGVDFSHELHSMWPALYNITYAMQMNFAGLPVGGLVLLS